MDKRFVVIVLYVFCVVLCSHTQTTTLSSNETHFINERGRTDPYEDHYRFGVRHEDVNDAFNMASAPLTRFQTVYKFNTRNMTTPSAVSPSPTWHRSDAEIHMDNDYCSAYAVVAYECEDTARQCENRQQTVLYKIRVNPSSISIVKGQLVYGYFRNPYTFMGLRHITLDNDSIVVLLHRGLGDDGGMASTLLFPSWNHYGQIDGLLADYRRNTSLDVYNDRYIRLGGTSLIDKDIIHYHLDKMQIKNSCYSSRPTFYTEELIDIRDPNSEDTEFKQFHPKSVRWITYPMAFISVNKITCCETRTISE